MNIQTIFKLVALSAVFVFAGCSKDHVFNEDWKTSGPIFVKKAPAPEPAPAPAPEPEPIPEPVPEPPSLDELNARAIAAFTDLGLEAESTNRGVNVYLPPEIYFDGATSKINIEARSKIAQIASEVNKDYLRNRSIEVSGHTDSTGPAEVNMRLSKERAVSATGELVFSKVAKTRINTVWKGETQLRYPELREDGSVNRENKARNRRVEFTILNPGVN